MRFGFPPEEVRAILQMILRIAARGEIKDDPASFFALSESGVEKLHRELRFTGSGRTDDRSCCAGNKPAAEAFV